MNKQETYMVKLSAHKVAMYNRIEDLQEEMDPIMSKWLSELE